MDSKPPGTPTDGETSHCDGPPAVSVCLEVLKKRRDFLQAARARKQGTAGMMVQARKRRDGEASGIRVGFTCSKKVGNAVARNRAKRRLREVAHAMLPKLGQDGWDYVLIGKPGATIERPFDALLADFRDALGKLHRDTRPAQKRRG